MEWSKGTGCMGGIGIVEERKGKRRLQRGEGIEEISFETSPERLGQKIVCIKNKIKKKKKKKAL